MKVNLSDKSKSEFIEHIAKQSINCWFEGDEFVMPSGQGKTSKGIVLYQLQVWELKQKEIDGFQDEIKALILQWRSNADYANKISSEDFIENTLNECADELERILQVMHDQHLSC